MDQAVKQCILKAVKKEPYAQALNMELVELEKGFSAVEMIYNPEIMNNIYQRAHGGAIYSLIDEAFETAGQTDGTIAVALNINVTYVSSPKTGVRLRAEAQKVSQTKKTAVYDIKVKDADGQLIAICQALAFCTGKPIPFLEK
ncbi:MAG: PaaI family thioesterase [Thermodesulfobacteriota bacterium]|nr:PaaI family thioesterase [Thermodesulfobacteriota bacterium]